MNPLMEDLGESFFTEYCARNVIMQNVFTVITNQRNVITDNSYDMTSHKKFSSSISFVGKIISS